MRRLHSFILAGLIAGLAMGGAASAATISIKSMTYSPKKLVPHLHLDGPIVQGDVETLKNFYLDFVGCRESCFTPEGNSTAVITLNSPGGSYETGLGLAKFLRENRIAAIVEDGMRCYSACAFAFLGGTAHSTQDGIGDFIDRTVEPGGILGFHAPYFPDQALTGLIEDFGAGEVFGESREMIATMVENLVDWNVDQHIVSTMVSMGPNETYDLNTPNDYFLVRTSLPPGSRTAYQPNDIEAVRNACIRLLAMHESAEPREVADRLAGLPFTDNISKDEFDNPLSGFKLSDKPLGLGHCSVSGTDWRGSGDLDIALYQTEGLTGFSRPMLSMFNREQGWSTAGTGANASRRIFQKESLNHFFLPVDMNLAEIAGASSPSIDPFDVSPDIAFPDLGADLEIFAEDNGTRISGKGDVFVFTQLANPLAFLTAKGRLTAPGTPFTYESVSEIALVRGGSYADSGDTFSWIAYKGSDASAIVRIEILKPDGVPPTEEEMALLRRIECDTVFEGVSLSCGN